MKKALVTGGSGGIGAAVCEVLANEGYYVYIGYSSSREKAEILAEKIGGEPLKIDVSDTESINSAVKIVGEIDLLVNNAGISEIDLFTSISAEKSSRIMNVNLVGAMELTRKILPAMINRKSGCIINISSMWGEVGASCEVDYSASKAGIINMSKSISLCTSNKVLCICPNWIDTSSTRNMDKEYLDSELKRINQDRLITIDEFILGFDKIINSKFNSGDIFRIDIKGDKLWVEKM